MQLTDPAKIRAILERDRNWSAYALADLAPGYCEHSRWFVTAADDSAIVLEYTKFAIPVVLAAGDDPAAAIILNEIAPRLAGMAEIYFVIRPGLLPIIERGYRIKDPRPMLRMVLEPAQFAPLPMERVIGLGPNDLDAIVELFRDGEAAGEAPDFFTPEMLHHGTYYGVRDGKRLAAAAGTHVLAPEEGVAGLGNIYTRRDCRGRGWGSSVISAVTQPLLASRIPTIVLNVNQNNASAIRLYERLGFRSYCSYYEIIACPKADPSLRSG